MIKLDVLLFLVGITVVILGAVLTGIPFAALLLLVGAAMMIAAPVITLRRRRSP